MAVKVMFVRKSYNFVRGKYPDKRNTFVKYTTYSGTALTNKR
jgi:hypothetical protein